MFDSLQQYVYDRRRGIIQSAATMGGAYAISSYVRKRLEEMKDKLAREKAARESLRRRFQTTHDDVCFTIMALIPTLASQILEDMDVEALTNELQSPHITNTASESASVVSSVSDGFTELSDSVTSASSSFSYNEYHKISPESSMSSSATRTRGQLWNEVKILALTRTLTTLYTTTLLSLLTAVQVTHLGRSRYIDSVRASDRAERARDRAPHFSLTGLLAREAMATIKVEEEAISEETELRYLTLSWWILHVGWKDVAARVRAAVSLKTKLSPSELYMLIMDIRRRVELGGTGHDTGSRRVSFLSSLLPPTPETTAHVLAQGGALPMTAPRDTIQTQAHDRDYERSPPPSTCNLSFGALDMDPQFNKLLAETRAYISGPDFCACTWVLMDGLRSRVFVDTASAENQPDGGNAQAQQTTGEGEGGTVEKQEIKIRLAGLLPGLARWSQLALNSTPNELIDNIMALREVNVLEAIIISDYQDRFPAIA
ncbi:Peroxin-3 [Melanogaster broomeanus]|nr:Peroxin-3 [Melanogaster broomeanus]